MIDRRAKAALELLETHYVAFQSARKMAADTQHTVPSDTKSWSQILVSLLTDLKGRARKKGSDLEDGSDVKAANVWDAIDTPRFNGAIPSGRITKASRKAADISALDSVPYVFFVLWDHKGNPPALVPRCRVWCVRAQADRVFRSVCSKWYRQRRKGIIKSDNFQLQPPRNLDHNVVRNECGNLSLPLLFEALRRKSAFEAVTYDPAVLTTGKCVLAR